MIDKTDQRLRLNLRHLEVFVATAKSGSTRAAADRIARSQSAASTALADLETQLGTLLFDRIGRRLVLNANGRVLLAKATALLDHAFELEASFVGGDASPLSIGASLTSGEYLLPKMIAEWKLEKPESQARLFIGNTDEVIDAVLRSDVEVGFIEGQRTHPNLKVTRWLTDEMVVVAAPTHPLAGGAATASVKQLAAATWVLREVGSGTRETVDRWLLQQLGPLRIDVELGSTEAIKQFLAAGVGVSCLSRHAVADAIAQGGLVALKTRLTPARRQFAVVVHRDKRLTTSTADFIGRCLAMKSGPELS
ncbi:DNA-binding transcriptional regulator YeiE [soil metagenome]